jgi:hypothetical protein
LERPIHTRRKKALECERAARLARKGGSALYFGTAKINNDFDMLVGKENGKGMTAKSASIMWATRSSQPVQRKGAGHKNTNLAATATVWRWLDGHDVHIDQAETSRAVR